jgi:subtilisin family serine protease
MFKQAPTLLLASAVALVAAACQPDTTTGPAQDRIAQPRLSAARGTSGMNAGQWTEADHYVVAFRGRTSMLEAAVAKVGGQLLRAHPEIGIATVTDLDDAGASALEAATGVQSVTRDLLVQWTPRAEDMDLQASGEADAEGHLVSDPTTAFFYPCQWNMAQCNGPGAWDADEFGAGATVAVLDTGVDPDHQDLAGRIDVANSASMLSSPSICDDFVPDQGTILDFGFHGSFVAGIIAGNGFGVTGIAPDATIIGVKVLNCLGSGTFGDIVAGIVYAANLNVDVINMSLGAYFPKSAFGGGLLNGAIAKAVDYAASRGVLVVSSSGNEGDEASGDGANLDNDANFVHLPSQAGSGIAAWAGDVNGDLAAYSNYGRSGSYVGAGGGDLTNPNPPLAGCVLPPSFQGGIISVCSSYAIVLPFTCATNSYAYPGIGTSFSAPLVSGVAALVDGQAGGSMNAGQLKTRLKNTADDLGKPGADVYFSHGRVNAGAAVGAP